MPIIKSAKKRVRLARKAAVRNVKTKRLIKVAVKAFQTKATQTSLSQAQSALDTAVKKGVLNKNKAARKKRQLAAQAKASGVKLGLKKATAKLTGQRTTTKKAVAKKPVRQARGKTTKKAPAKKTVKK